MYGRIEVYKAAAHYPLSLCIINDMASVKRPHKMTLRLSDEELAIREALELDTGGDGNTVMRQGMIDLAKSRGIKPPEREKAVPEGTARRKR